MRRLANWTGVAPVLLWVLFLGLTGCNGINTPGKMEWVQPHTSAPHVGTVYLIRGWMGVYSAGIDEMAKKINQRGGTAYVFQDMQFYELAMTMEERYKDVPDHEPICFIGHSRGCDAELIISRHLAKAGVAVDVVVTLDSVDQEEVSANVRYCYNYWMPGVFGNSNLLRGVPLRQEPGSKGQLFNYNLDKEYRAWRGDMTDHISLDDDPGIQERIIEHVFEVCPERSKWVPPVAAPASQPAPPPSPRSSR